MTDSSLDIWADIDAALQSLPEREPGDIDIRDWMAHYETSETSARRQMTKLAQGDGWEYIDIRDPMSGNGRRKVLRRVK